MPSENQCAVSLVLVALCEVVLSVGNVDVLEPLLIRSPASAADPGDGFGWTAVFHELEPVSNGDSTSEVLRKTRYPYSLDIMWMYALQCLELLTIAWG